MPKIPMDYSNTIFYKIYCIDPSINELYIGHTTNFVQRKHAHKQGCNNVKSPNYKCKLYQAMRENSGWDNWKMDIIAFHECDNLLGAKIQEQKYYEEYKATLNSIEPLPKPKPKIVKDAVKKEKNIFYCNKCNIHFDSSKIQDVHNTTRKHIKNSAIDNGEIETTNIPVKFLCKPCNYICYKKGDYNRHITTRKHILATNINTTYIKNITSYKCENCDKEYADRTGLWRHTKSCVGVVIDNISKHEPTHPDKTDMTQKLLELIMSKNQEFMTELVNNLTNSNQNLVNKMIEIMPNIGNNSHDLSSK
jgi:Zn finger protein HypA/HybF involved in hydrogenase expression